MPRFLSLFLDKSVKYLICLIALKPIESMNNQIELDNAFVTICAQERALLRIQALASVALRDNDLSHDEFEAVLHSILELTK